MLRFKVDNLELREWEKRIMALQKNQVLCVAALEYIKLINICIQFCNSYANAIFLLFTVVTANPQKQAQFKHAISTLVIFLRFTCQIDLYQSVILNTSVSWKHRKQNWSRFWLLRYETGSRILFKTSFDNSVGSVKLFWYDQIFTH